MVDTRNYTTGDHVLAYHSDPNIKNKYIARVRMHRELDHLIQGVGWSRADTRGCAVGCTLEVYDHSQYPIELGIPEHIAHLEDALFEALDREGAMAWPEQFLSAITPGADLSGVWPKWAIWALEDPEHGVIRNAVGFPRCERAIRDVAELWRSGGTPAQFAWAAEAAGVYAVDARSATATAAAARAAEAAARAAEAAWAATAAAARAADRAAEAAGVYAVDAREAWTRAGCDKLIELLEAAPCPR